MTNPHNSTLAPVLILAGADSPRPPDAVPSHPLAGGRGRTLHIDLSDPATRAELLDLELLILDRIADRLANAARSRANDAPPSWPSVIVTKG
ncbi:hypothetical protein CU669_20385 [Paramagnetospirillum kuznetsovii]|uniref:Uncharacterized protein n=1 Tax=Paramagnetospirillum kuznetsovii TaxID=2053833 RepID=A0A364NSL3_9PROT|nr:hypothetical protein [Paramagnetospirillum kuznetsovii]RAU20066.1 hypothetical protein CU669_20385 [Paramagnetospirillum kuznetsovii]